MAYKLSFVDQRALDWLVDWVDVSTDEVVRIALLRMLRADDPADYYRQAREYLARSSKIAAAEWISVNERKPLKNTIVWIAHSDEGRRQRRLGYYSGADGFFAAPLNTALFHVTHWAILELAPKFPPIKDGVYW